MDRSSRPQRSPRRSSAELIERVERLRRERWTGVRIAQATGLSRATVSRILTRLKLNKAKMLEPQVPIVRYEHAAPGDLLHLDIKKFARIVKAAIASPATPGTRPAAQAGSSSTSPSTTTPASPTRRSIRTKPPSLRPASSPKPSPTSPRFGIAIRRVLTDNGPCFYAHHFAHACRDLGITHMRTRIYTPRTNGKAERFIQTAIREWAYARATRTPHNEPHQLEPWTHQYNWHRPHASLNQTPPISRSGLDVNNLLTHHS